MRLRVLHVIPALGAGGAERLLVGLLGAMDPERFEVAAVSLYPPQGSMLEEEVVQRDLRVIFLNKRKGPDPRVIPALTQVIKSYRPHAIHTHLYVLRYALLPALWGRVPVRVHTVHNVAQREVDAFGKRVHSLAFRWLGVVPVSISMEVQKTVKMLYGPDIYTPLIYNGIPLDRFLNLNPPSIQGGRLRLLHIGRFAPPKNHLLLLESFAQALANNPSLELWLVGDGPLRGEIERQVYLRGLQEHVRILGLRKEVPEILEQTDVLVLSSDWEGVPLVVLEAMAAGRPVIATKVGGIPELIEDGVHGFLVPPRDPPALAKAILYLARNPQLIEQMGQMGRRRVLDHFAISRTAEMYGDLYWSLYHRRRVGWYA